MSAVPQTTRLRYIKSKDPAKFSDFLGRLSFRVQIYSMVWDGNDWFLWVVPPDVAEQDIPNIDLNDF